MSRYRKDPEAVLDWQFDWTAWLADGEAISSHDVTVDGITLDSSSETGGVVTCWLSGGTAGASATVACKVVTSDGRTDERTITIAVRER